jgi:hypothetical protein
LIDRRPGSKSIAGNQEVRFGEGAENQVAAATVPQSVFIRVICG